MNRRIKKKIAKKLFALAGRHMLSVAGLELQITEVEARSQDMTPPLQRAAQADIIETSQRIIGMLRRAALKHTAEAMALMGRG